MPLMRVTAVRLGLVLLGAVAGSLVRHLAAGQDGGIPWAVLWINVAGAALAGWLVASIGSHARRARILVPLAVVGAAGALTTFGGLAVDVVLLADAGAWGDAGRYAAASVVAGPIAAAAGLWAGSRR